MTSAPETSLPVDVPPVAPLAEVGSETLAAALASGRPDAIDFALRNDVVVVPVTVDADGRARVRLFPAPEADTAPDLCLFSSAAAYADFLAGSPDRCFAIRIGRALDSFLRHHQDHIGRVALDPAGPHSHTATVAAALAGLTPQPGDVDYPWIDETAADGPAEAEDQADAEGQAEAGDDGEAAGVELVDFDLRLPRPWARIDVADPDRRARQIQRLARRQTRALSDQGASLRADLRRWLTTIAEQSANTGGRLLAFLDTRHGRAAFALSATVTWLDLGPNTGPATHLDRQAAYLKTSLGPSDSLLDATTLAGPILRHTHQGAAPADLDKDRRPVLLIDYWLQRPDGLGLVKISFSTPHADAADHLTALTDTTVLNGTWVARETDNPDTRDTAGPDAPPAPGKTAGPDTRETADHGRTPS